MTTTAKFVSPTSIEVVRDGSVVWVPDDMTNRDRRKLAEWEAQGGVIAPYIPPTPPTQAEQDEAVTTSSMQPGTFTYALAKAVFILINDKRVRDGDSVLSPAQFRTWIMNQMRV